MLQRQGSTPIGNGFSHAQSKIERGECNAKREKVSILSKIFNVQEEELLSLWLADKVYDVVKDENVALKAMQVAVKEITSKKKYKKNSGYKQIGNNKVSNP